MQINQLFFQTPAYPADLAHISDPPQQLYLQGQLTPERVHVAIVGTRRASAYGKQVAYNLALELARAGLVIVSGLAEGIDSEAHRGALDAGGLTVAVQGRGLADVFPTSNRALAKRILEHGGAIVSEYEPKQVPTKWTFPQRNRIVAGLSRGVVVVESAAGGGSMLTVKEAILANRTVMAVPGDITKPGSAGCNNLLAEGHTVVRNSTDVLIALGLNEHMIPLEVPVTARSPHEAKLLELLRGGTTTTQDLIDQSGLAAADFANIISLMEITGKIRNLGAGHWSAR